MPITDNVLGRWYYLYLILDVFSRKIVGFEVHDRDDADHAAHLVKRTALAEGRTAMRACGAQADSPSRWSGSSARYSKMNCADGKATWALWPNR